MNADYLEGFPIFGAVLVILSYFVLFPLVLAFFATVLCLLPGHLKIYLIGLTIFAILMLRLEDAPSAARDPTYPSTAAAA